MAYYYDTTGLKDITKLETISYNGISSDTQIINTLNKNIKVNPETTYAKINKFNNAIYSLSTDIYSDTKLTETKNLANIISEITADREIIPGATDIIRFKGFDPTSTEYQTFTVTFNKMVYGVTYITTQTTPTVSNVERICIMKLGTTAQGQNKSQTITIKLKMIQSYPTIRGVNYLMNVSFGNIGIRYIFEFGGD